MFRSSSKTSRFEQCRTKRRDRLAKISRLLKFFRHSSAIVLPLFMKQLLLADFSEFPNVPKEVLRNGGHFFLEQFL